MGREVISLVEGAEFRREMKASLFPFISSMGALQEDLIMVDSACKGSLATQISAGCVLAAEYKLPLKYHH